MNKRGWRLVAVGLMAVLLLSLLAMPAVGQGVPKQFFDWAIAKKLTVTTGGADFQSAVTMDAVTIDGALALNSTLDVDGATTLNSTLDVDGATTLNSTLDVDGNVSSGTDAFTITDQLMVDGAADGVQLTVQGYTTQTNALLVLEQSDGTDVFTVTNAGNMVVGGTSDLQGNVSDTGGVLTIADNAMVDGQADATQLTVQGYTTQTNALLVLEQSDGTDVFTVTNAGNMVVGGTSDLQGNVSDTGGVLTIADNAIVDGQADAAQLTVQGYATQTNELLVLEQSDGTDKVTVTDDGHVTITSEADSDTANYDKWVLITGEMTGVGTKDRNYGLSVEMTRPAGQELTNGDHDEAGIKVRVDTEAVTTTAGTVLRGMDVEAKADNPSGTVTNLHGALISAKSDTGAGDVADMWGLSVNAQNNAAVTSNLFGADIRIMRQAATQPTSEAVLRLRSGSTTGSGADAALLIYSNGTGGSDDFDYLIDGSTADVNTADIRLSNGETIDNTTDTAIQLSGFFAFEEATVIDLASGGTITPTASYQPITNATGGSIDTDATTAIADGPVAGTILVICNEDAQNVVIKDNANTQLGGDVTLTGGADDCLTVLWDGTDWTGLAFHDN